MKNRILVLGCVFPDQYETMIKNEIRGIVYTKDGGRDVRRSGSPGKNAYFHIKIDEWDG